MNDIQAMREFVRLFNLQVLAAFLVLGLGALFPVAGGELFGVMTLRSSRTAGRLLEIAPFIGTIAVLLACFPRQNRRFWWRIPLLLTVLFFGFAWPWLDSLLFVCLGIGATAALFACFLEEPWWRPPMHFLFAPLLWVALQRSISPLWYLSAFVLLFLVFRGAASGRVPLFLSGEPAARRLAALLPGEAAMLDAGAGIASLLLPLSRLRPDLRLVGVENAPLPWLIGWLRTRNTKIVWRWGNFWRHPLAPYSAVYCFLSPAPMPELWRKAKREMQPESLFISNAFPVPDVEPDLPPDAKSEPALYVYRLD
ncbi:MAG: class I SAM-dependent methyltransferase [Zoogloeaceae bacterium]|jgi:hypothetical protein|nr:class I SAM-dependent methyltransferase [Zoogloeaceae bacterium]